MTRARDNANLSPTIADARMPNLTGDVTTVEGAVATTIATDAVDIAMLSATGTASSSTFLRGDNAWEAAGGGKVLQVVQTAFVGTGTTTNSSNWTDDFLQTSITPSATASKVLVMVNLNIGISTANIGVFWRIDRAGTTIYVPASAGTRKLTAASPRPSHDGTVINSNAIYLDSPSTTSATQYQIEWRVQSGTAYLNRGGDNSDEPQIPRCSSSMTLIEIGA